MGFWMLGLLLFVIQEIPYMVMPFLKITSNPIMEMQDKSMFLSIGEKVLGSLCIAVMVFLVKENDKIFSTEKKIYFVLAMLVLLTYYVGWVLYFNGYQSVLFMIAFLVAMPPLYYTLIGLWRSNIILSVIGGLFLITHISNVWNNLR